MAGFEGKSDVFPLERDVFFTTTKGSGNDLTYTWQFSDGTPVVASRNTWINHRFPAAGTFLVRVTDVSSFKNFMKA
jgi:hypothetical protein